MSSIGLGLFGLFERIVSERMPFRATMQVEGVPHRIIVSLINHTKDTPLFVHAVRIHFGTRFYNHFFHLSPCETVEIVSRAKHTFTLDSNPIVGRFSEQKTQPDFTENAEPSFDSPRDLFRAIAHGKPRDSWLEVDFNEFEKRVFLRHKLQPLLRSVYDMPRQQT